MKNLMIVESPAKAKTIEKYLGKDFTVRASFGHVRDLPKGDKAIDISNNFEPQYIVLDEKQDVIRELKKICKESDIVWLATDEDREGEAISWHLAEVLGLDPVTTKRVVFNEITKKAILAAIEVPRTIDLNLVNAQQARRVLDRLVGFQLSPILWSKIKTGLSAGRVQSVAVRLIVEREREINEFNSTSAFKVTAEFDAGGAKVNAELPERLKTSEDVASFFRECVGAAYSVGNIETKPGRKSPAAPFTTSTLQQEASRKLGFSVAQTMRVAQGLYESGKITYMRTDSVNLSNDALAMAQDVVTNLYGANYHERRQFRSKNKNAQEAHEAIRPTDMSVQSISGERNEQRLYDLIWKRTLASQMADARLEKTTATIQVSTSKRNLIASGEVMLFDGFLKVYMEGRDEEGDEENAEGVLPPLKAGQALGLLGMNARQRFASPPPRYTEASLVKKLEELGIGRPSTYAPTISTIQNRNYVIKDGREGKPRDYQVMAFNGRDITTRTLQEITGAEKAKLFPTDLGGMVTDFLKDNFPSILDYSFTAKVEEEFDEIAEGQIEWHQMIQNFYTDFAETVQTTKTTADRVNMEKVLGIDPVSGLEVKARFGRFGPMVQIGPASEDEKPRYASLRSEQRLDTITLEEALDLFKLPRVLGEFEGENVRVNVGRFGPYVQLGKMFVSIPKGEEPLDVNYERAVELINAKRLAEANRLIATLAEDVQVLNGRYGPYIKYKDVNVRIPKGVKTEEITLEMATPWYEEQKDKPKRGKFGAKKSGGKADSGEKKLDSTAKKAAPKKAAAKKASKKTAVKKAAAKKAAPKKAAPKKSSPKS
jgi:DNA topoisomerase-1